VAQLVSSARERCAVQSRSVTARDWVRYTKQNKTKQNNSNVIEKNLRQAQSVMSFFKITLVTEPFCSC